jgi:hypothetical protein
MSDAFVAKLSADGSALIYSTYLGGSGRENVELINYDKRGIAIDAEGSAYVSGETESSDFPTVNALQSVPRSSVSAFATKLTPDGSALDYSTYLGCEARAWAHAIAVDAAGQALVTGVSSTGFPLLNPIGLSGYVFVTKISADGSTMLYSTHLGGGDYLQDGRAIAVDAMGNAYVTGSMHAPDFPTTPNAFQPALADAAGNNGGDAFVAIIHSGNEPSPPAPTIVAPGSFAVTADSGQCSARVRYDAHVENATPCVEFICDPPNGTDLVLPVGTTTVNCFAHDVTGGSSVYSFTITVRGAFPETPNFSTLDSGGGRSASPNYTMFSSLGGIGGTLTAPSPPVTIDCGYIGQLHALPCF